MAAIVRAILLMMLVGGSVYGGLAVYWPRPQSVVPVQVAALPRNTRTPRPTVTPTSASLLRLAPLLVPSATPEPTATASPTPEASATPEASPTLIPSPTALPHIFLASFQVGDGGMRHNIKVALDANGGALQRVVIAPGAVFSFNDSLGPNPNRLPWKSVGRIVGFAPLPAPVGYFSAMRQITPTVNLGALQEATAVPGVFGVVTALPTVAAPEPTAAAPEPTAVPPEPTATTIPTPERIYVLGGGVCDLASRYVVAGRRVLPSGAFRFKRHPGGISGVRDQEAVSIWTTDNGFDDNDLIVTNTTNRWLVFEGHLDDDTVTVLAWLQDGP